MNRIFKVDAALIPAFILSAASGIGMHISGHISCHEVWHAWAVAHMLTSTPFLGLAVAHVIMHKAWYKSLFRTGRGHKSPVTIVLSVTFLLLVGTGIALLFVRALKNLLNYEVVE